MTENELLQRLQDAEDPTADAWLLTLRAIAHPDETEEAVVDRQARLLAAGAMTVLLDQLASTDPLLRVLSTTALASLCRHPDATSADSIAGLSHLIDRLSAPDDDEAAAAADIVAGLSGQSPAETARLAPAIPPLLTSLAARPVSVQHPAGVALWSLTRECNQAAVCEAGGIEILLEKLTDPDLADVAAGTLANLAYGDDRCRAQLQAAGAITALLAVLTEPGVEQSAAGALWNLTASEDIRAAIIEAGAIEALVPLLSSADPGVQFAAAGLAGNLVRIDQTSKDAFREAGGIPPLVALLQTDDERAQQEAIRALRTVGYNNPANQGAIEAAGGITALIALGVMAPEAPEAPEPPRPEPQEPTGSPALWAFGLLAALVLLYALLR